MNILISQLPKNISTICCVTGCGNSREKCPDMSFYNIPQDKCAQWTKNLCTYKKGLSYTICMSHFQRDMFTVDKHLDLLLNWTAMPSLLHVFNGVTETEAQTEEERMYHSYCEYYKAHRLQRVQTALNTISHLYKLATSQAVVEDRTQAQYYGGSSVVEKRALMKIRHLDRIASQTMDRILLMHEGEFHDHMGMGKNLFIMLTDELQPKITNKTIIPIALLLYLTLRHLKGDRYRQLQQFCILPKDDIVAAIKMCIVECNKHFDYMFKINEFGLRKNAREFSTVFNLPNCVGCVGMREMSSNGITINVTAICDTNCHFRGVDVNGRRAMNAMLKGRNKIGQALPGRKKMFPLYLVATDDFEQKQRVMVEQKHLPINKEREHYNKRIKQSTVVIDNAFQMLVARWTVFLHRKRCNYRTIRCAMALHNFCLKHEGGCNVSYGVLPLKSMLKKRRKLWTVKLLLSKEVVFQKELMKYFKETKGCRVRRA